MENKLVLGEMKSTRVFLGGTTPSSDPLYGWRGRLIPALNCDYFNPVVPDWTPECIKEEYIQKSLCTHELYVITPEMKGVFSIAEAIDASNKKPNGTIFCVLNTTKTNDDKFKITYDPFQFKSPAMVDIENMAFDSSQLKSLDEVGKLIENNGGKYFKSLEEVAAYLNSEDNRIIAAKRFMKQSLYDLLNNTKCRHCGKKLNWMNEDVATFNIVATCCGETITARPDTYTIYY